jgi:hypothetical protein
MSRQGGRWFRDDAGVFSPARLAARKMPVFWAPGARGACNQWWAWRSALRMRVAAPFLAAAERSAWVRELCDFPRPEPLFLPPPSSALTVAQARRSASLSETPRFS